MDGSVEIAVLQGEEARRYRATARGKRERPGLCEKRRLEVAKPRMQLEKLAKVRTTHDKLEAALQYARLGVPMLPCHVLDDGGKGMCDDKRCRRAGKHPIFAGYPAYATTDLERVREW